MSEPHHHRVLMSSSTAREQARDIREWLNETIGVEGDQWMQLYAIVPRFGSDPVRDAFIFENIDDAMAFKMRFG
ncbi:MAG: hypothetical protein EOP83_14700 [Verrucomicrobiaceae bacterium]|nr:MAG: hypothetical protein EOP83_14700 [Verrucomicrobiaceae bacterium]